MVFRARRQDPKTAEIPNPPRQQGIPKRYPALQSDEILADVAAEPPSATYTLKVLRTVAAVGDFPSVVATRSQKVVADLVDCADGDSSCVLPSMVSYPASNLGHQ